MMNVIDFPKTDVRRQPARIAASGSVTLFLHVRRTTLIAHLSRRPKSVSQADERVGKT